MDGVVGVLKVRADQNQVDDGDPAAWPPAITAPPTSNNEPRWGQVIRHGIVVGGLCRAGCAVQAHGDARHKKPDVEVRKEQTAWGIAGAPKSARRTIQVSMSDAMRFTPSLISVRRGETMRVVLRNEGSQWHESGLGTELALDEYAVLMIKFPNMAHDEPHMAHGAPGKTGLIVWTFNRAGEFDFACLIAGHYQAGMFGRIIVTVQ